MVQFWPDGTVSVILLPSGEPGDRVLTLAREWTERGLLAPALWVRPAGVDASVSPARVSAFVLGLDLDRVLSELPTDLFEALARQALTHVRLVKVRYATPSRAIDEAQDAVAEILSELLTKAMPAPAKGENIATRQSRLTRITLVCAPSEFVLEDHVQWVRDDLATVVVASPEDRANPGQGMPSSARTHVSTASSSFIWLPWADSGVALPTGRSTCSTASCRTTTTCGSRGSS